MCSIENYQFSVWFGARREKSRESETLIHCHTYHKINFGKLMIETPHILFTKLVFLFPNDPFLPCKYVYVCVRLVKVTM